MWLPANGNWLLGSMGGMIAAMELCLFCFGAIAVLPVERTGSKSQGNRGVVRGRKVKLGLRNQNARRREYKWGFPGRALFLKSAKSLFGKAKLQAWLGGYL
jgi:hypothetical protein